MWVKGETVDAHGESVRDMLAGNLRRARVRRGLSLSELSRRSLIGKATLSQLEAGAGNPTIETVFSLSRALEMPISDLLGRHRPAGLTVVRGSEVETLSGEVLDLRMLRRFECGDAVFEVYDQRLRAGGTHESLGHVGVEHIVVQSGSLSIEVDGERVELEPGDYISYEGAASHSYTAGPDTVHAVLLLHYRAHERADLRDSHPAIRPAD